MADDTRCINHRLYRATRVVETGLWRRSDRLPWVLYCDGDRLGFYRSKKDLWAAAENHAAGQDNAQARHVREVERQAAIEGGQVLDRIRLWHGKRGR